MNKLKSFLKIASLCLFSLCLFIPNAFSATIRVPSQQATIQSAIDAASSGDAVLVSSGAYYENITLADGVTLRSTSGTSSTFIDGNSSGSCVTMASNSTIDGFTIQNGAGTNNAILESLSGGGIYVDTKTNITITNCTITNNSTANGGGLFMIDTTSSTISNCTFSSNTVTAGGGGAYFLSFASSMDFTMTNCTFSNNTAPGAEDSDGGAILNNVVVDSTFTITDCIFQNNSATNGAGGVMRSVGAEDATPTITGTISRCIISSNSASQAGALHLQDGTYTITNCLFYSNSGDDNAGSIGLGSEVAAVVATVTNCTFANNTENDIFTEVAGETFSATIRNCIFYGNSNYGIYEKDADADVTPINCLFYNNTTGLFYDEGATPFTLAQINALSGASENISGDPLFVNTDNNNYHLQSTTIGYTVDSPCVDAGTSTGAPTTDLDSATRPQGVTYDIGAYEAAGSGSTIATLTKNANKEKAAIGQIITYTLNIANSSNQNMVNTHIYDTLPKGFKYLTGSAKLNNVSISEPEGARTRDFNLGTLTSNATYTLKYKTVVGSGVSYGKSKNIAHLQSSTGSELSPSAEETVLIVPNPVFNAATIIGKVFLDHNKNGYQDEGEEGLPYISLITEDGFLATTDKYGRYHIEGLKPQTKIVAVMTNTLPSGATLTTENPVLLRFSVALTMKANFGVFIEE